MRGDIVKLPVIVGLRPLLDKKGRVVVKSKKETQRLADKMASKGFVGVVTEGPIYEGNQAQYYRITFGAQRETIL